MKVKAVGGQPFYFYVMKHIKIEIVANEHQQEELIALLDDHHAAGFEQTDDKLVAYFDEARFDKENVLSILNAFPYSVDEIEARNWNEEWEKNFEPVVVSDFVAVRAHFHQPVAGVRHEIVITPKMSFGTGHHATTYLMMQEMQGLDFNGKSVFDFGTGTGILAILAEKLGAQAIKAIDVDDWSLENAKENCERNDCQKINVSLSSNIPPQHFDLVLANINRNVILSYMPQLAAALSPQGQVLFSGLLVADEADVTAEAQKNGLRFKHKAERHGWLALLFNAASYTEQSN